MISSCLVLLWELGIALISRDIGNVPLCCVWEIKISVVSAKHCIHCLTSALTKAIVPSLPFLITYILVFYSLFGVLFSSLDYFEFVS